MSIQENTKLVEEWFAAANTRDIDRYADLFADNIVVRSSILPQVVRGRDAARHQMAAVFTPFSAYNVALINAVVSDDQFVCQLEFTGKDDEPINLELGIPTPSPNSSGRPPQGIIFVAIIREGKVAELHQFPDYRA